MTPPSVRDEAAAVDPVRATDANAVPSAVEGPTSRPGRADPAGARDRAVASPESPAARRRAPSPPAAELADYRRVGLGRLFDACTIWMNRGLDVLPIGRWLHRRIQASMEITDVRVPIRGLAGTGLDGLTIAFLSDIHAGSYVRERELSGLFERVAEREPDVVCLGGDLLNSRERELLLLREPLRRLRPRFGIWATPGNHDLFWCERAFWSGFLHENGVQVLDNRGVRLELGGGSLWLAGVDDLTEGRPDADRALAGRRDGEPAVVVSHHPDFFAESVRRGVDLTLAGHTHGGQINLFGWAPVTHTKRGYKAGRFTDGDSTMYVGRGMGVSLLPIRIGARAEVPIVQLVGES